SKLNIFLSDLLSCLTNKWNIAILWVLFNFGIEQFLNIPLTVGVVVTILFSIGTKNMTEVPAFMIWVQMVFFNKFLNTFTPHEVIRIIKVNLFNRNSITSCSVTIIWNALSYPVVTCNNFHVPNFIFITE